MQSNGSRRTLGSRAAAAVAAALLAACSDVSPYMERNYVRVGAPVLFSPMGTVNGDATGPFPGGSFSIGSLFQQSADHETGIEVEYANNRLAPGHGDLTGVSHGFFGGVHRTWNLEGRIRPSVGLGGEWQDVHVRYNPSGSDPHGFGIYGDVGVEYMITAIHSIGIRLRDAPVYDNARQNTGIRNNIELSLIAAWHF